MHEFISLTEFLPKYYCSNRLACGNPSGSEGVQKEEGGGEMGLKGENFIMWCSGRVAFTASGRTNQGERGISRTEENRGREV